MNRKLKKQFIGFLISLGAFLIGFFALSKFSGVIGILGNLFKMLGSLWVAYYFIALIIHSFGGNSGRTSTVATMVRSICSYAVVILSIFFGLKALGADLTTTIATVGITGLLIGLGAQSLIEDLITGVFLTAEGKYNIGDTVVIDDFRGKVTDIGMRTTTLEDMGGNKKIINNSDIRNFQNRSQSNSFAVSTIAVGYSQNLAELENIFAGELPNIYEQNQALFLSPPQYLGIEEFLPNGALLKFAVESKEDDIFIARRELNRQLKLLFDRHHIEIPFPQMVVHGGK